MGRVTLVLLAFVALVSLVFAGPNPPIWKPTWQQSFFESTQIISQENTTGVFYYDSTINASRTDRANGNGDRYCGSVHPFSQTPCTHLVWQGYRYLVFPELNECCMCCTEANGCGILMPDWLVDGGTYQGTAVVNGTTCDKWLKYGLQANYWYQSVDGAVPIELDQVPNDVQYFYPSTYKVGPLDRSIFQPPSTCSPTKTCATLSVCTIARKMGVRHALL